jgi:drug/metabolite transporter (DMT)-like permease
VVAGGIAVSVVAVSSAAVLVRVADAHPLAVAFWRCALGAAVLAPFALRARTRARRRGGPPLLAGGRALQVVASGVFLAVHFALWISSLGYTTVASSAVLVAMAPLFVGMGAALFLREAPSRRAWSGIVLAVAGAAVIGAADLSGADLGRRALVGDLLAFGGAAALSGYLLIGRAARQQVPVAVYASGVYGVAALVLLPACLVAGAPLGGYDRVTWLAIGGMVLGPQLLGHTVYNTLLSTVTATTVAVVSLAEPVGATLLALLVLAEAPAAGFWLGAPLVLAGVWRAVTRGAPAAPDS